MYRRPTALQDRTRDSDDEVMTDRDYDVAELANNLSQAFRYKIYGNEDAGEVFIYLMVACPYLFDSLHWFLWMNNLIDLVVGPWNS